MKLRKEFDSIGSLNVPNDKYWGASTQRSNKFFNIGKILVNISIIKSIAIIKRSAAIVHSKDKLISRQNFKRQLLKLQMRLSKEN
jgi:fumarate hydratase class II